MALMLFSRWGRFISELPVKSGTHRIEINGEDSLSIMTDRPLSKGDRVLWDDGGRWREYVFDSGDQTHGGSEAFDYTLDNSFMWDLSQRHIRETTWEQANCSYAARELVKLHPAWSVGTVQGAGVRDVEFSRESAYQGFLDICGLFNCEIEKVISVDRNGVTKRTVNLLSQIGTKRNIRFDYGHGMGGVTKKILPDAVLTACYGYGGSIEVFAGTENPVPDDYEPPEGMEKPETEQLDLWCYVTSGNISTWGLMDGRGGAIHAEGDFYENSDITDMNELVRETTKFLNEHSAPSISYETHIPLASIQGAYEGDTIQVVDKDFTPELRLEARIGAMERGILTRKVESATFGTVTSLLPDALARALSERRTATRTAGRLSGLNTSVNGLRDQLASMGSSTSERMDSLEKENKSLRDTIDELSKAVEELKGGAA